VKVPISLTVNGDTYDLAVDPWRTLAEVLREDLGLTGTKVGCGHGDCGACTVILDGRPVVSCLTMAMDANGRQVLTVEGLAPAGDELHPIQKAFVEGAAIQCGFCTPGMEMSAYALLQANPQPSEEEIRKGLSGNLCRCTGYNKIIEAVNTAAGWMVEGAGGPGGRGTGSSAGEGAGGRGAVPLGNAPGCKDGPADAGEGGA